MPIVKAIGYTSFVVYAISFLSTGFFWYSLRKVQRSILKKAHPDVLNDAQKKFPKRLHEQIIFIRNRNLLDSTVNNQYDVLSKRFVFSFRVMLVTLVVGVLCLAAF